jgi:integrase
MVAELAARHALAKEIIDSVTERTGGVPLFIEEVTRLLLERGEQGSVQEIPPTLQQSLMARLDRLGPARMAGVPDSALIDLSLVKLPDDALMFPSPPLHGESFSFTKLRNPRNTTKEFGRKATALGFAGLRLHDLRGTHETHLLDKGVSPAAVAKRCGHDPATMLRSYAKRTRKADTMAAEIIGMLSKGALGQ